MEFEVKVNMFWRTDARDTGEWWRFALLKKEGPRISRKLFSQHENRNTGDGELPVARRGRWAVVNGDLVVYSEPKGDEGYSNLHRGEGFMFYSFETKCFQAAMKAYGKDQGKDQAALEEKGWKAGRICGLARNAVRAIYSMEREPIKQKERGWFLDSYVTRNVNVQEVDGKVKISSLSPAADFKTLSWLDRTMGGINKTKKGARRHNQSQVNTSTTHEGETDVDKANAKRNRKELGISVNSSITPRSPKALKVGIDEVSAWRDRDVPVDNEAEYSLIQSPAQKQEAEISPELEDQLLNPPEDDDITGNYITTNEGPRSEISQTDPTEDISENMGNITIGKDGTILGRNSTPLSGHKGFVSGEFSGLEDLDLKLRVKVEMRKSLMSDLDEYDEEMIGTEVPAEVVGRSPIHSNPNGKEAGMQSQTYLNKLGSFVIPRRSVERNGASGKFLPGFSFPKLMAAIVLGLKPQLIKLASSTVKENNSKRTMQDINKIRLDEKCKREEKFPVKMAIYSNIYHAEGDQLLEEEAAAIKAYLEFQLDTYNEGDKPMGQVNFADGGLKAGMLIIDCLDENSGDWLVIAISSIKEEAPYTLNREFWGLDCKKIKEARPLKTFLIRTSNPADSWYDMTKRARGLGYESENWHLLHTKVESKGRSFTFMDRGDTARQMDPVQRSKFHPSTFGAANIFIKWLKGEDEPGEEISSASRSERLTIEIFFKYRVQRPPSSNCVYRARESISQLRCQRDRSAVTKATYPGSEDHHAELKFEYLEKKTLVKRATNNKEDSGNILKGRWNYWWEAIKTNFMNCVNLLFRKQDKVNSLKIIRPIKKLKLKTLCVSMPKMWLMVGMVYGVNETENQRGFGIWQLNCWKRPIVGHDLNALCETLGDDRPRVVLIQEGHNLKLSGGFIYRHKAAKKPRAGVFVRDDLDKDGGAQLLEEFTTRDQVAVNLVVKSANGEKRRLILASAYLPGNIKAEHLITKELRGLVAHCKESGTELIIGMDANSHDERWQSKHNDKRGARLVEFIDEEMLVILNEGDKPTYVRNAMKTDEINSIIDITIATPGIASLISDWEVSDDIFLSDHRCIKMNIKATKPEPIRTRLKKFTNWENFENILCNSEELSKLSRMEKISTIGELEAVADKFNEILNSAYFDSSTVKTVKFKSKQPWFGLKLHKLRIRLRKALRLALRSKRDRFFCAYRSLRSSYKRKCSIAKFQNWKKFLSKLDSAKETARIFKFLEMGGGLRTSAVRRDDGTYTMDTAETMRELMKEHFKGARVLGEHEDWPDDEYTVNTINEKDFEEIQECTEIDKIIWAVKSLSPFKSPGTDEIFPALLQKSLNSIAKTLQNMFRASLSLGYVPKVWRGTKVTFIPKPGKSSYGNSNSYRPISLMSFVLKLLEKLVDKRIRFHDLERNPMNPSQHAYKTGKSVESALHSVLNEAEKAIEHGGYCLSLFIDIAGAFSEVNIESVTEAAREKGISEWCVRWVDNMLRSRRIKTSNEHCTDKFVPVKGLAQGGSASPLYWLLTADTLIEQLQKAGLKVVAFADDLVVMNSDKNLMKVKDQINKANRIIERWCRSTGLDVNPDKTQLMLFTNKNIFNKAKKINKSKKMVTIKSPLKTPAQQFLADSNPYGNKICKLRGVKLKGVELKIWDKVKYLGISLDRRLNMNHHINEIALKAARAYGTVNRICKQNWGLEPSKAHYIYKSIILPRITYGAIAFWHKVKPGGKGNLSRIDKLRVAQSQIICKLTGAMRRSPLLPQLIMLGVNTLEVEITKSALESFCRLERTKSWRFNGFSGGHGEVEKLMNSIQKERSSEVTELRWRNRKTFTTSTAIRTRVPTGNCLNVFVDASCDEVNSGIGYRTDEGGEGSAKLKFHTSNNEAEKVALWWAVEKLSEALKGETRRINFWSDSMNLIRDLDRTAIYNSNLWRCNKAILRLTEANLRVEVGWAPKKAGIGGMIAADLAAKTGRTSDEQVENEESFRRTKDAICEYTKTLMRKIWKDCTREGRLRCANMMLTGVDDNRFSNIAKLGKTKLRLIMYIFTGKAPLGSLLSKMGKGEGERCRFCKAGKENILHLLTECREQSVKFHRRETLGEEFPSEATLRECEIKNYLELAGRIKLATITRFNRKEAIDDSEDSSEPRADEDYSESLQN